MNWGLGIGDWGLGIGDWAQSPIPNPISKYILLSINHILKYKLIFFLKTYVKNKFYMIFII
jgi:hypothetical protein